ncbi:MAG: lipopolysaccharide biosynthesis protein [Pseudomonadales bacterium]
MDNIYKHMMRGAAWTAMMRWVIRLIGFVNIIILARILTPQDFGLVAMGTIVVGLIQAFTEFGTQQLLIREQNITTDHINTAWTVKILQGAVVALLLVIFAPLAASYFNEPRAQAVINFLALSALIGGAGNIGITLARKELNFSIDFWCGVYARLALFLVTLVLALTLKSYWALVYGHVAGAVIGVVISYMLHPYRPRLCIKQLREYLNFSLSMVPLRIAKFINEKADSVVVGGIAGAAQLGIYNTAADLAKMMTMEIAVPLGRGLFPAYAKLNHDPAALAHAFSRVLAASGLVIVPLGLGIGLIADDFVLLVLGEKWLEAAFYIKWLVVYAVLISLIRLMNNQILIVAGFEKRAAFASWLRVFVFVGSIVIAAQQGGVEAVAMVCPFVALALFPIAVVILTRSIPITVTQVIAALWRSAVAGLLMGLVVYWLNGVIDLGPAIRMFLAVVLGGLTYIGTVFILWCLSGYPAGAEQVIYQRLKKQLGSNKAA